MSLQQELGLRSAIENKPHEALLSIILTATLLEKEGNRLLRPLALTESQFNILMLLRYQSDGGELNQTRIGDMLLVNRSNVTGLIDRMEQAGWVQRSAQEGDRRVKQVSLTPAGRELLEKAEVIYREQVKKVIGSLPKEERVQLCRTLEKVREKLRASPKGEGQ
jgi:DNA-binding MarR family transcriptional regulator